MTVSLRFGSSPEEQEEARGIVGAMREGYLERKNAEPQYVDKEGRAVYRILLHGFRWVKYDLSAYSAQDGPDRQWNVGRDFNGKTWGAVLHYTGEDGQAEIKEIAEGLRTMREAREKCEHEARRMPWYEGAPW